MMKTLVNDESTVTIAREPLTVDHPDQTAGRSLSDYDLPTGEGVWARAVKPGASRMTPRQHAPQQPDNALSSPLLDSQIRAALRMHWNSAREGAKAMVDAAENADQMGLGIAAANYDQALAELWDLSQHRDIDWQTILNHAQGMMRQFYREKRVESLTKEQCRAILTLTTDCLGTATKSITELTEALRLIKDAGFDPYAAISGDPADELP